MPYRLIEFCRRFRRTSCLHFQGRRISQSNTTRRHIPATTMRTSSPIQQSLVQHGEGGAGYGRVRCIRVACSYPTGTPAELDHIHCYTCWRKPTKLLDLGFSQRWHLAPTSAGFLHGLLFVPEDGDDISFQIVGLPYNQTGLQPKRP
jgi:hypothetical protein